jgi:diguanylate cyclase
VLEAASPEAWGQFVDEHLNRGVGVAFLDVDGLAELNERRGHKAGDGVIAAVGCGLAAFAAGGGCWCRLHGDEYALALPDASIEDVFLTAERLRTALTGSLEGCTVTLGVAQAPRDAAARADLLRVAETACQLAKETTGGRVGLPARDEMVLKSCYYPATAVRRLKQLAERTRRRESDLFREALDLLLAAHQRG